MFGDRLRTLRKQKKLRQEDVASKIGSARTTYAMYEQGKRQPDNDTLQKLADYFDTTTDYLLGRTDVSLNSIYLAVSPKQEFTQEPGRASRLSHKDERDIAKRMEKIKKDLLEGSADGDGLSFKGEPMSEEAIESLLAALEHAERMTTIANKKYTPKKHRDKNN